LDTVDIIVKFGTTQWSTGLIFKDSITRSIAVVPVETAIEWDVPVALDSAASISVTGGVSPEMKVSLKALVTDSISLE
jgi:hypothetical protein